MIKVSEEANNLGYDMYSWMKNFPGGFAHGDYAYIVQGEKPYTTSDPGYICQISLVTFSVAQCTKYSKKVWSDVWYAGGYGWTMSTMSTWSFFNRFDLEPFGTNTWVRLDNFLPGWVAGGTSFTDGMTYGFLVKPAQVTRVTLSLFPAADAFDPWDVAPVEAGDNLRFGLVHESFAYLLYDSGNLARFEVEGWKTAGLARLDPRPFGSAPASHIFTDPTFMYMLPRSQDSSVIITRIRLASFGSASPGVDVTTFDAGTPAALEWKGFHDGVHGYAVPDGYQDNKNMQARILRFAVSAGRKCMTVPGDMAKMFKISKCIAERGLPLCNIRSALHSESSRGVFP